MAVTSAELQISPVAARKSLPMTPRDVDDLAKLTADPSYRKALLDLGVVVVEGTSDAKVLHALLRIALGVVQEKVAEDGYAALAQDAEYLREGRAIARRRPLDDSE